MVFLVFSPFYVHAWLFAATGVEIFFGLMTEHLLMVYFLRAGLLGSSTISSALRGGRK